MIKIEEKVLDSYLNDCFEDLRGTVKEYFNDPTLYKYMCCKDLVYFLRGLIMCIEKSDRQAFAQKYVYELEHAELCIEEFTLSEIKKGECR